MEFNSMQFNAYIKLLNKYLEEKSEDKRKKLKEKLELTRRGFLQVNSSEKC